MKTLVREDAEQAVLQRLHDLRASGLTLRAVAAELTRLGHRTRKGGPWINSSVCRQLARRAAKQKE